MGRRRMAAFMDGGGNGVVCVWGATECSEVLALCGFRGLHASAIVGGIFTPWDATLGERLQIA